MFRMSRCYWCHGTTCHLAKGCFAFTTFWLVWDVGLVIIKGRAIYEWITFGRQKDTNKWLSLPERLFFLLIIFIILVGCDIGMMITMKLEKRRLYFVLLTSFPIRISVTLMDLILVRVNLKTTTDSYLILVQCFYVVISIYFMIVAYSYYLDMIDSSETHEESSHYCSEESPTDKDEDLKSLDPAWAAVIERREASRAASRRKEQQTLDKKRRSNTMGRRKTIHSNDGADAKPSGARNVMAMRFSIIPNTQSPSKLEIQLGIAEPSKWETSRPSCAAIGAPPSAPAIFPQCWLMPPEESTDRTVNVDTSEQSEEYVSTLNDSESSGTVKRRIPPSALKKEKVQNAQDHNDLEVFRDEVISGMEMT